ncbi:MULTISPECIES: division/cell wall cluster transcriptional repressor MraZ [unclassified Ruminococcus]|uniref:division/cell wall cluster transcriptional repressor MraZ n=1 Tax=unclassified Ruminococcus TaxID=2608920 RepID=UPI00210B93F6|nr:division/cell wall cluster transcriptional repressor MraZ [Ruminococcus sp. zg-924]MCQ4114659.1 division/cell wall cluster transcriptional repressor MraZ [Ruminococcus sp. zg-921]
MFFGTYKHNLDPKNRIIMPAKFREELGDTFFVTKGLSNCLWVMSAEKWTVFVDQISARPAPEANVLQHYFFAGADQVTPNAQGRFVVKDELREFAELEKEVAIVGAGKQVEIWSGSNWDKISGSASQQDIAELMKNITF